MFFCFDGLDGVGKSTQMDLFVAWLTAAGHDVLRCQDPGSTPLGEQIRAILLGHEVPIDRTSEMLLFMAARAQLVREVIRPALERGQTIVSDRYLLANLVYQGHAGGLDVEAIRQIGAVATGGLMPDLVIVLDMAPEAARARLTRELDRMELQGLEYQLRLRAGFLAEAANDPKHIAVVNAAREIDAVQADIRRAAERVLAKKRSGPVATELSGPIADSPLFARCTDRARKVMKLAQVEAQKLNHPAIDTVHVFLGLLSEGSGVAANVLKNLEVDLESARRQAQASSSPGGPSASVAPNSLTPDTLVVMDFAREEARTLNHNYVGTEHFLLGLLRAVDGVTAKVLAASNVTADSVRAEVLNLVGRGL